MNYKIMIIVTVCLVIAYAILMNFLTSGISKEQNKYKAKMGQKFVLEKDTLTVIDYSLIMETFTLSNGKEVNASLILNN